LPQIQGEGSLDSCGWGTNLVAEHHRPHIWVAFSLKPKRLVAAWRPFVLQFLPLTDSFFSLAPVQLTASTDSRGESIVQVDARRHGRGERDETKPAQILRRFALDWVRPLWWNIHGPESSSQFHQAVERAAFSATRSPSRNRRVLGVRCGHIERRSWKRDFEFVEGRSCKKRFFHDLFRPRRWTFLTGLGTGRKSY
jgi:hypothetical protein